MKRLSVTSTLKKLKQNNNKNNLWPTLISGQEIRNTTYCLGFKKSWIIDVATVAILFVEDNGTKDRIHTLRQYLHGKIKLKQ